MKRVLSTVCCYRLYIATKGLALAVRINGTRSSLCLLALCRGGLNGPSFSKACHFCDLKEAASSSLTRTIELPYLVALNLGPRSRLVRTLIGSNRQVIHHICKLQQVAIECGFTNHERSAYPIGREKYIPSLSGLLDRRIVSLFSNSISDILRQSQHLLLLQSPSHQLDRDRGTVVDFWVVWTGVSETSYIHIEDNARQSWTCPMHVI